MNLKGNLTSKGLQGSIGKSRMQGILGTNPAAIPITVDNALSLSSTNPVQNKVITAAITNRLWSDEVKAALLQIVEKVAYVDEHGHDYYDALYDALYPPVGLDSIGAVFDAGGATIYTTDTLDDLKQYLTVTAYYSSGDSEVVDSYTLSGSMDAGTQTITVSYGGKTTTFTVTVVALEVTSINAVLDSTATIYITDTLETLRQYLVVTATYSDSSTAVVTDYTLSGTLALGTDTITVSYAGLTDTFDVVVIEHWSYGISDLVKKNGAMVTASSATCGIALAETTNYRRSFLRSAGSVSVAIQRNQSITSQTSDYYPIKVPAGATGVSISITPSTQYAAGYMFTLTNGKYSGMTASGDSGYTQGTHSKQFSTAGDNCYLLITTKYNNAGTSYPTEPTGLDITFS